MTTEDTVIDVKPEMIQNEKLTATDIAKKTVFGLCWLGKKTVQLPEMTADCGKVIGKTFADEWKKIK
jgi:hypothetical protein